MPDQPSSTPARLLDELQRAADEYDEMPEWAKPVKTDPDALIAGSDHA